MKKKKQKLKINDIFDIDTLKALQFDGSGIDPNFSNLSKSLLQYISENLWMPKVPPDIDVSSNSWFTIKNKIIDDNASNVYNFLYSKLLQKRYEQKSTKNFEDFIDNEIEIEELEKTMPGIRLFLDLIDEDFKEQQNVNKPKKILGAKFDPSKIGCKFIVTDVHDKQIYGRHCNEQCMTDSNCCKIHTEKKQKKFDLMEQNLCQHIITQRSGKKDRKGMICGKFTYDSKDPKYCNQHEHRHCEESLNLKDDETKESRSFKVRYYPRKDELKKLSKYFGGGRFTYNSCKEYEMNELHKNLHKNSKLSEYEFFNNDYVEHIDFGADELKKIIVTDIGYNKFLAEIPKEIRAFAVTEYVTNRNNAWDAYYKNLDKEYYLREKYPTRKHKEITEPVIKFRKKKDSQCITINKDAVKIENGEIKIYRTMFSDKPLNLVKRSKKDKRLNKILDGILYHDIKIVKTLANRFYVCFTDDVKIKVEQIDPTNVGSIDPGFRTFATAYSETKVEEIGKNMYDKIIPLIKKREELKKIYRKNYTKRNSIYNKDYDKAKNNYRLINEKIKNKVNDLHYKVIAKLMNDYTLILIPLLNTTKMLEGDTLSKTTKNVIAILCHRKFFHRLEEKNKSKVKKVTEVMTTKTCSNCFSINDPGTKEKYVCNCCKKRMGRDINASKNIYIQQIAELLEELLAWFC